MKCVNIPAFPGSFAEFETATPASLPPQSFVRASSFRSAVEYFQTPRPARVRKLLEMTRHLDDSSASTTALTEPRWPTRLGNSCLSGQEAANASYAALIITSLFELFRQLQANSASFRLAGLDFRFVTSVLKLM